MKALIRCVAASLVILIAAGSVSVAAERKIEEFYGNYVGKTVSQGAKGTSERDLSVSIEPLKKKGFSIAWTTVIPRKNGEASRKSYKINFQKSKRANIYAAGMRPNLFGGWIPLDPMKGEPYIWARIEGETLSVFAMHVIEDGSYEMQAYHRTLTDEGMKLVFSRSRAGEVLKTIEGTLKKVDE